MTNPKMAYIVYFLCILLIITLSIHREGTNGSGSKLNHYFLS